MPKQVIVQDLRKHYAGVEAVRGVSFEIEQGEIFGLLGPNGAGKTTTLECIIGLREPDQGSIEVCGFDVRKDPAEVKQRIGSALQASALQDKITPLEALTLFSSFYRQSASPEALLRRFALQEKVDAPFDTLSGGQRQRLALALAFVNNPQLVFLDEPTTGLDPQSRRELHARIAAMRQDGYTVLLTTHYIEEAEQLCDRIAIIDHGQIIATGSPRELMAKSNLSQKVSFKGSRQLAQLPLSELPEMKDLKIDGSTAQFRTGNINRTLPALIKLLEAQQVELLDLHVDRITLEDVFISLTGSSLQE